MENFKYVIRKSLFDSKRLRSDTCLEKPVGRPVHFQYLNVRGIALFSLCLNIDLHLIIEYNITQNGDFLL